MVQQFLTECLPRPHSGNAHVNETHHLCALGVVGKCARRALLCTKEEGPGEGLRTNLRVVSICIWISAFLMAVKSPSFGFGSWWSRQGGPRALMATSSLFPRWVLHPADPSLLGRGVWSAYLEQDPQGDREKSRALEAVLCGCNSRPISCVTSGKSPNLPGPLSAHMAPTFQETCQDEWKCEWS